jgi:hypothetical protein
MEETDMAFEVFNRKSAGRSPDPNVTIQKRGTFSLNSAAAKALSGGAEFEKLPVELLYDRADQAVGLRRSDTESPNVYFVRKQPSSESYIISGQAFTVYYKIDTTISRRFRARMGNDGILTFKLTDRHVEVERTGRPPKGEFDSQETLFGEEEAPE